MCDIFGLECEHEGCERAIDWHIGDYKYSRDKFTAYCWEHGLEEDVKESDAIAYLLYPDGVVYDLGDDDDYFEKPFEVVKENRDREIWFVEGPEVGDMHNCPNMLAINYRMVTLKEAEKLIDRLRDFEEAFS